ncbi:hypothetical protein KNP414_00630 [Paenibacillus mucilaginosus KNP414]|uniref:Uncharacterized protein n=1 Tax=Paenibacillus mucilaginosus (strain KNP414) TaxID=1036673 RepID=F8FQH3_PAEMK|nr:hypothetical protein KNP414_00630 [Paenibacillus mucilaginosus KNP414]
MKFRKESGKLLVLRQKTREDYKFKKVISIWDIKNSANLKSLFIQTATVFDLL